MTVVPPLGATAGHDRENPLRNLIPEQRALLDRIAAGATIAAAAAAEFVSLRTANRRIARARKLFGVRTTREAVLAYQRHGNPPRHPPHGSRPADDTT